MKLSVVIPVYNAQKYISRCVDSLLCQNCNDMEIILVDDGSTDDSGAICEQYAAKHNTVKVLHKNNGGEGNARNAGVQLCSGEWITYVDADDYVSQDFSEKILNNITDEFDVLAFGFIYIERDCCESIKEKTQSKESIVRKDDAITSCFLAKSPINESKINMRSAWGKVFRSSLLKENHIVFDEGVKIGTDMLYMLKVYSCTEQVRCISEDIYFYYYNPNSITNVYKPQLEEIIKSYNAAINGWLSENKKYEVFFQTYRLDDIILYLKYVFFHPSNKSKGKRKYFKSVMNDGKYKLFYNQSKKLNLIQNYSLFKRITFWCAIHNWYDACRLIYYVRYKK